MRTQNLSATPYLPYDRGDSAGPERRVFREHIGMDPIAPQANGPQLFYGLRYHIHIHINTPEEDITFHDQVGYWLWEPQLG